MAMGEVAVCSYREPSSFAILGERLSVLAYEKEEHEHSEAAEISGDENEDTYVRSMGEPDHSFDNNQCLTSRKLLPLPKVFLEYLAKNGIDPRIYSGAQNLPRYVRIKPEFADDVSTVEAELGYKLSPISWLQGFFSLAQEAQIAGSQAYQLGKIYGLDAASGAAVQALGVVPGDNVLDLCAAPGAKLCMVADYLGTIGTLTGVDIARHRLAACRTMLIKYGLGKCCRLFVTDGTKFSLLPSQQTTMEQGKITQCGVNVTANNSQAEGLHASKLNWMDNGLSLRYGEWTSRRTRKEKRKAKRARMKSTKSGTLSDEEPELLFYGNKSGVVGLKKDELFENTCKDGSRASEFGYDKVLVDAECTHDGSLKHICKYEQWGWDTLEHRVLDHDRLVFMTHLQLELLTNGFKLLKVGGTLVYCTCSFTTAQNEEVIQKFLSGHSNAELLEIDDAKRHKWPCKSGLLVHTLRFDPLTSNTSGLFVAKVTKKHSNP